jgi:putative transposase
MKEMKKFQNKYRIPSARLEKWDYGANGAYFITICTDKMQHYFGEVYEREMQLNELGKLAHDLWQEITNQFPYVELGNFVIMPNHMHGILIINKSVSVTTQLNNNNNNIDSRLNNNQNIDQRIIDNETVETRLIASVLDPRLIDHEIRICSGGIAGGKNPMLNENISRIIRWYKGRCSFEMRKIHADFKWHSRFYDHIIRNSKSFETIQTYIENNPSKWGEDKFHK